MMKRPKNRELQYKTFGDAGRIQKPLDEGRCPKCLVVFPKPAANGSVTCPICRLTVGDYSDMPKVQRKEQGL